MDVLATLQKLPARCFVGPTEARGLAIEHGYCIYRGMSGYVPMPSLTDEMAIRFNEREKAERHHVEAMQAGSMFGWEVPGADPDHYVNRPETMKGAA
jgi:hypothetical protein